MRTILTAAGLIAILLVTCGTKAASTNGLSDAEIEGRQLAQQLLEERPADNFTNTGVLRIRDAKGRRREMPVKCEAIAMATNWLNRYEARLGSNITDVTTLVVTHRDAESNRYLLFENQETARVSGSASIHTGMGISGNRTMIPFADSDFWIADLGLEFFHWPEQKVLKHELRRSRACTVLESTNPNPAANGYSRVVSWIDSETLGIIQAEAYDPNGKLLKEFYPKDVKKVKGQWQVASMEIRNVQTGSRTRLEFDLKTP
jgi:hypothetical protein